MPKRMVRAKKNLSHTLCIRIDSEDMRKLEMLAGIQGVGVTTYARMLLKGVLTRPEHQLAFQAMEQRAVREEVERFMADAQVPPDCDKPEYFVFSASRLNALVETFSAAAHSLIQEAVKQSHTVCPRDEVYAALKERLET